MPLVLQVFDHKMLHTDAVCENLLASHLHAPDMHVVLFSDFGLIGFLDLKKKCYNYSESQ